MSLFSRNKESEVQRFVVRLINNHCPELKGLLAGPRRDRRVNLVVVVSIIPIENKRPQVDQAFTAVTKEFSSTGVGVVLDQPRGLNEVILGFRFAGETTFIRAHAKHLNPMGGGFYQLGLHLMEVISAGDYPDLASIRL
jgi:hypothetical protein